MNPRDVAYTLLAFVGLIACVGGAWFAVMGLLAAVVSWPLLWPVGGAAYVAARVATSPSSSNEGV